MTTLTPDKGVPVLVECVLTSSTVCSGPELALIRDLGALCERTAHIPRLRISPRNEKKCRLLTVALKSRLGFRLR
jgi:hypothetical protein